MIWTLPGDWQTFPAQDCWGVAAAAIGAAVIATAAAHAANNGAMRVSLIRMVVLLRWLGLVRLTPELPSVESVSLRLTPNHVAPQRESAPSCQHQWPPVLPFVITVPVIVAGRLMARRANGSAPLRAGRVPRSRLASGRRCVARRSPRSEPLENNSW